MSDPTIEIRDVSKSFGDVVALIDVSLALGPGLTGILGPNGAGKSTLLRLICGLTAPTEGEVRLLGADPRTDASLYRRIGLVPQQEELLGHLDARAFVRLAAQLHGLADADTAARHALRRVDLDPNLARPTRTYSQGMRQRVKLAQALVHDPEVLVLDEPLNGLDPRQRAASIRLFRSLASDGRTVLVSSHVLSEVERFGERILLLVRGHVAAEGDFHDIRDLMDDRPRRIAVRAAPARPLAAALVDVGAADGITLEPPDRIVVDTMDAPALRRRIAALARDLDVRLLELAPLDEDLESVFRYLVGGGRE
ncbi:MAG TPA: ABC transporter ATP-binding protein [Nitriliruptorales bacterium]